MTRKEAVDRIRALVVTVKSEFSCSDREDMLADLECAQILATLAPDLLDEDDRKVFSNGEWRPIKTVPKDRYVLLYTPDRPEWDGNMDVGKWFGDDNSGCFWSCGGPNGGLELSGPYHRAKFTNWQELPEPPK